jgi:hypothetical protein
MMGGSWPAVELLEHDGELGPIHQVISHSVMAAQLDFPPLPRRSELRKIFSHRDQARDYLVWRYNNRRFGLEQVGQPVDVTRIERIKKYFAGVFRVIDPNHSRNHVLRHHLPYLTAQLRRSTVQPCQQTRSQGYCATTHAMSQHRMA